MDSVGLLAATTGDDIKTAAFAVLIAGYIIFRLMQRHPVSIGWLIAIPVVLLIVGADEFDAPYETGAVLLFAGCIAVEFALGLVLGRSYRMWEEDGAPYAQGTKWTIILWVTAVAIRGGFIAIAQAADLEIAESSEILITLAFTFIGQDLVIARRAGLTPDLGTAGPPPGSKEL